MNATTTMPLTIFSSRMFSFQGLGGNRFRAAVDRSTLDHASSGSTFRQIHDDAADVGFVVESAITGRRVTFVVTDAKRDSEGDTVAWIAGPTQESIRECPRVANTVITIFNT